MTTKTWLLPLLLVPLMAGLLVGWVSGISMSPVASTLIAIFAGLLGAIGFKNAAKQFQSKAFAEHVLEIPQIKGLTEDTRNKIQLSVDAFTERPSWLPTIAGIGILAFLLACYIGLLVGIRGRVPQYANLLTVLPDLDSATPLELASLYRLTWHLRSSGLAAADYENAMTTVFQPIFATPSTNQAATASPDKAARTKLVLATVAEMVPTGVAVDHDSLSSGIFLKKSDMDEIDSIDSKLRQTLITDREAYEDLRKLLKE